MRGRGLKQIRHTKESVNEVAPHAGAWIETLTLMTSAPTSTSPPMRGRGLKHRNLQASVPSARRPPCGGVD